MILRIKHESHFTTLCNNMLNDKRLSFKARGLLAYMLTKPNDWKFYREELKSNSDPDGKTSIRSAINELISARYLTCHQRKTGDGKWGESEWEVRETPWLEKPSTGNPLTENRPLLNTKRRINTNNTVPPANTTKFDPLDLPIHLMKHPTVVKAWTEFVEHRKVLHAPLTEKGCVKLFKKLATCSPETIVSAIDTSIECRWKGIFPRQSNGKSSIVRTVQGDLFPVKATPDGQLLTNFVCSVLGNEIIRQSVIENLVRQMHIIYDRASSISIPFYPDKHPNDHFPWSRFFNGWIEFLEEKQQSGFVLRSIHDLELSGCRWREYMQYCASCTNHDWVTGKHI